MQTGFGVEYRSDSSYRLLMRFLGMSFKLPDPFDKRRDEEAITRRMTEIRHQVAGLLKEGWEVYTVDEVRVEHEAETRRMWLPRGRRTKLYVDREKASQSFFGALSLTTKKMRIYPIEGNQNTEQTILMMDRLQRETEEEKKIAVVLDNARFHHARALTDLYAPGQALERITPIYLPPYAPDLGSHGTRVERRQEQHRQPPTRHPGENLHGLHHLHHQPHLRLRPRAPPSHTTTHRSCLIPAILRRTTAPRIRRLRGTTLGVELALLDSSAYTENQTRACRQFGLASLVDRPALARRRPCATYKPPTTLGQPASRPPSLDAPRRTPWGSRNYADISGSGGGAAQNSCGLQELVHSARTRVLSART